MKYAGFMPNDFLNGEGICVSLWVQGCNIRCSHCHNPESWDFDGGYEVPNDLKGRLIKAICANGIQRNFSVLGGEPLCPQNRKFVKDIIKSIKIAYPHIKIFLWTGYEIPEIETMVKEDKDIEDIFRIIDVAIVGRFEYDKRDISLKWRGSSNQKIIMNTKIDLQNLTKWKNYDII